MPITTIHSFLVHPGKNRDDAPAIAGTRVTKKSKLLDMLEGLYAKSDSECEIDIAFGDTDGEQKNPCRDLVVAYAQDPQMAKGRAIAQRLQSATTNKPGLGLLFLILGKEGKRTKLVISRFPADSGVLAELNAGELSVEFLEHIFMKSAYSYKAVLYEDTSFSGGFWAGKAIDRQINQGTAEISDYWIIDFLASDFKTTSAAGTRRLADALRSAVNGAPTTDLKAELIAAVRLARGLDGQMTSVSDFMNRFNLSSAAKLLMEKEVKPHLRGEKFKLDLDELTKHVPLRSVELKNGDLSGVMIASESSFDKVFKREKLRDRVRFVAEGQIVDERLRKRS